MHLQSSVQVEAMKAIARLYSLAYPEMCAYMFRIPIRNSYVFIVRTMTLRLLNILRGYLRESFKMPLLLKKSSTYSSVVSRLI